ncbi:MAG: hypothetical protein MHMPM18_004964, partial [Marteilia pararefringens]
MIWSIIALSTLIHLTYTLENDLNEQFRLSARAFTSRLSDYWKERIHFFEFCIKRRRINNSNCTPDFTVEEGDTSEYELFRTIQRLIKCSYDRVRASHPNVESDCLRLLE